MSIIVNNTDNQLNINNNGVLDVYAVRSIKSISKGVDATGNYYIAINFIANDKNNSLRIYLKDVSSPVTWTNDLAGANAALADLRDWLAEIIEVQVSEANDSILIYGYDGVNNQPVSVDSDGHVNTNVNDAYGNAITSTSVGANVGLDVNIVGGVTLDVNLDAANDEVSVYGSNGGTPTAVAVNASGQVAVQDGGGSLTIDSAQLPASLGKKAMTGSMSVTLANDELGIARTTGILRPTAAGNVNTVPASGRFYSVSVANVGSANGSLLGVANSIKPGEVLNFSADAINNYFTSFAYDATGTEFIIIFVY